MEQPIKLKDEPVEEQSPELKKSANGDKPVREGEGDFSIRNDMKKKDDKSYPLPSAEDTKWQEQDEYDITQKGNKK